MRQPNNDLLNKGPFTARSQLWPVNCSPNVWAHLRPEARSGPLIVRRIFGPNYSPVTFGLLGPDVDMGPFQPDVTFGLGMARAAHGPYMVRRDIGPTNGPC